MIRIRTTGQMRLAFPLLLPVLEETLEEAGDWMGIWVKLIPNKQSPLVLAGLFLQSCLELLAEFRKLGSWHLIKVDTPEARVYIDLK